MTIAITLAKPSNFSPNCMISYWVAGNATLSNLDSNATMYVKGYYDQAGYDAGKQPMQTIPVTIPAAQVSTVLASDSSIGTYLLSLTQFIGGTAAQAA